jgi:hypothetical protein
MPTYGMSDSVTAVTAAKPFAKESRVNSLPSLFDDLTPEPMLEEDQEVLRSEEEVFALAREVLPLAEDEEEDHLPPMLKAARRRRLEKAEALGLVAKWADYRSAKGHIAIHDPGSGQWVDLPYKEAPPWAQREARKRSELYRSSGDARAFDYTAAEMNAIWEEENPPQEEEGIVEEYELPDD